MRNFEIHHLQKQFMKFSLGIGLLRAPPRAETYKIRSGNTTDEMRKLKKQIQITDIFTTFVRLQITNI